MMGYGWDGGPLGWIWMLGGLLVMVGVVVLIVWAVSAASRGAVSREPERPTALDILRERFARGEITQAEFEQAKKTLGY
ncbi:MAG TPA: SHOCT domain-containing protein [Candidatus Sulfomarinibacteraceae bacterium]|nr:SHOCT domain-containing protein [Candidatus Sulfomarinibacteraceae bacterium]